MNNADKLSRAADHYEALLAKTPAKNQAWFLALIADLRARAAAA